MRKFKKFFKNMVVIKCLRIPKQFLKITSDLRFMIHVFTTKAGALLNELSHPFIHFHSFFWSMFVNSTGSSDISINYILHILQVSAT